MARRAHNQSWADVASGETLVEESSDTEQDASRLARPAHGIEIGEPPRHGGALRPLSAPPGGIAPVWGASLGDGQAVGDRIHTPLSDGFLVYGSARNEASGVHLLQEPLPPQRLHGFVEEGQHRLALGPGQLAECAVRRIADTDGTVAHRVPYPGYTSVYASVN
jgi:hypothetical protein